MQTSTASSSSSSTNWAELLNRHRDPWPSPSTQTWDGPAPKAELHDWPGETTPSPGSTGRQPVPDLDDVAEDRTSCSASSVDEFDATDEEERAEQDNRDVHDPPPWTMKQWQDWESAAGPGEDDDGTFMQLSMSEEGELHNLGVYDEGRRELRGLLRELATLEDLEEGPEGRWALRSWLVRWRHVLGVLQSLTDILERRLEPQPRCTLPTFREPRVAAQRTRLLGLAGRLTSILLGVARDLVAYHQRLAARLPEGVRLPPRPGQPRRERSRSRDDHNKGQVEEGDGTMLVQTFSIEEWQGLIDNGILGADIGELDGWLGELARRVGDHNLQPHVRAQYMWSLGVFTRALRGAIRTMNFIVNALERREVEGGMYQPVEDATRGRVLAGCCRPAMVTASIFHQAVRNGVDDAYTHPDSLPPRLQCRERPPRRDPGRVSAAMMTPRSTTVEEEIREGEDGRGRDRTPRRAQARALRNEHIMAEVPASSMIAPSQDVVLPPLNQEADSDSGESWPRSTTTASFASLRRSVTTTGAPTTLVTTGLQTWETTTVVGAVSLIPPSWSSLASSSVASGATSAPTSLVSTPSFSGTSSSSTVSTVPPPATTRMVENTEMGGVVQDETSFIQRPTVVERQRLLALGVEQRCFQELAMFLEELAATAGGRRHGLLHAEDVQWGVELLEQTLQRMMRRLDEISVVMRCRLGVVGCVPPHDVCGAFSQSCCRSPRGRSSTTSTTPSTTSVF